jgi:hypothetical protein
LGPFQRPFDPALADVAAPTVQPRGACRACRGSPITRQDDRDEVTDVEAAVRDLEARGVAFVGYAEGPLQTTGHIAQMGPARGAWFRDPDGNFLGLRQG